MGLRAVSICLLVSTGILAIPAAAAIRVQSPPPFKIFVTVEAERDEQILESIRKLRIQEDRLGEFIDELKADGFEWDDPHLLMLQRQLRELRRRIWRLERDRFN
jgi:hypothetical protein